LRLAPPIRSREVALRLALGAGSGRILRQLFTEAVLISLVGGAIGLWGSVLLLDWLSAWRPFPQFAIILPIEPDVRVYLVALLLSVASGFLFGAGPVRQVLRTDPYQVLKSGSVSPVRRRFAMRDVLLALQIAICAVLVTSSLVAVRGLERSLHGNFGIDAHHVLLVDTDLATSGYTPDRMMAMQQRMADAMRTIPGVRPSASLRTRRPCTWAGTLRKSSAMMSPISDSATPPPMQSNTVSRPSTSAPPARRSSPVARSRFHDDQHAPRVAVVNETFARKVFGGPDRALDQFFKLPDGSRIEVSALRRTGSTRRTSLRRRSRRCSFPCDRCRRARHGW
jgi:ABC-type antimicrobial peptide transport system, permease component